MSNPQTTGNPRLLPELPEGYTMDLYQSDDWRCDIQSPEWHKLASEYIGIGSTPREAVLAALEKIS